MTNYVIEAVNKARKFFEIEDFPGNLFSMLDERKPSEKYKLLLFKEDIANQGKNG